MKSFLRLQNQEFKEMMALSKLIVRDFSLIIYAYNVFFSVYCFISGF